MNSFNNKLIRKIKTFLFPKSVMLSNYNKNARRVTSIIRDVIDYSCGASNLFSLLITDVNVQLRRKRVIITLGRPGLLIGKGGRTIDEVTKRISEWYGIPMKVIIKESYIF